MKEEIISVGIDIGTSTTQIVFTKIILENISSGARVPQIQIIDKKIIYRSEIFKRLLKFCSPAHVMNRSSSSILKMTAR